MAYSDIDQEVVILKAATEMLQGMVNHSLLMPLSQVEDTNVQFKTDTAATLFNILLVDFLSPVTGKDRPYDLRCQPEEQGFVKTADTTFLFYLRQVIANPLTGHDVTSLKHHVEAFASWLEDSSHIERMNLPSAQMTEAPFAIQRMRYLKLCGNIAKHSFARLGKDQANLLDALATNGVTVKEGHVTPVLEEFFAWFHHDLFLYHASTIVEFLNNIRWAIYDYLRLAHLLSETEIEVGTYKFPSYNPPPGVSHDLAKELWWGMMWQHHRKPFFPRFSVDPIMKRRS